jgi:hypothetical protein
MYWNWAQHEGSDMYNFIYTILRLVLLIPLTLGVSGFLNAKHWTSSHVTYSLHEDYLFKLYTRAHTFPALRTRPKDTLISTDRLITLAEQIQSRLDDMYSTSSAIKCPFWRRRTADMIDSISMIFTFIAARHKSLDITICQLPGCKAVGKHVAWNADGSVCKHRFLDMNAIIEIIRSDWCPGAKNGIGIDPALESNPNHKGYYITGRLNSTIYRDDCLFDGPDPDMPVRGLRKYLSAASHLFDHRLSYAVLHSIQMESLDGGVFHKGTIVATWELGGVLMLPWRPKVKSWTGKTIYHLDQEGLVALHEEKWDISVSQAFVSTLWPSLGDRIWGSRFYNRTES